MKSSDYELVRQIFSWVTVARRPLGIDELREAIGIEPLQESWDTTRFVNNVKKTIAICGNLVFIDEEQQTVHFTHNSVKQYLLSPDVDKSLRLYHIDFEEADAEVGAVCVTYLNFAVFDTQLGRTAKFDTNITGVPSITIQRSLGLPSANRIALDLLRRKQKFNHLIGHQLHEASDNTKYFYQRNSLGNYSLLPYAKRFWLEHTKRRISPASGKIWSFWCTLLEQADRRDLLLDVPWTFEDLQTCEMKVIEWLIAKNHCTLTEWLLFRRVPETERDNHLVAGAAAKGYREMLDILVSYRRTPQVGLDSALQSAAGAGHLDIVQRLLSLGANVSAEAAEDDGRTALQAAAEGGHLSIIERLLLEHADVNALRARIKGKTALEAAAGDGHLAVVERLLQANADLYGIGGGDIWGKTALEAAAEGGHLVVIEKLLQAGADVDIMATQQSGKTALQAAAEGGFLPIVERLLEANANVEAEGAEYGGRTALQAAAEEGHLAVVERLLLAKANVNAPAGWYRGRTAIQAAAGSGHLAVVEILLRVGANVNAAAARKFGVTALRAATNGGHTAVAERLHAAGAEAEAQ